VDDRPRERLGQHLLDGEASIRIAFAFTAATSASKSAFAASTLG